jgi:broad specificity phosphatase PhoE
MSRGKLASKPDQGETFLDMQARFVPFIDRLLRETDDSGAIVLVSHGGLYRCMLPLVLVNVSKEFALNHAIANTAYIVAESTPKGLVCLQWCGECVSHNEMAG